MTMNSSDLTYGHAGDGAHERGRQLCRRDRDGGMLGARQVGPARRHPEVRVESDLVHEPLRAEREWVDVVEHARQQLDDRILRETALA